MICDIHYSVKQNLTRNTNLKDQSSIIMNLRASHFTTQHFFIMNQQTMGSNCVTHRTGTQQERPESPTITPPWACNEYSVHKLHQGDILKKMSIHVQVWIVPLAPHIGSTFQSSSNLVANCHVLKHDLGKIRTGTRRYWYSLVLLTYANQTQCTYVCWPGFVSVSHT